SVMVDFDRYKGGPRTGKPSDRYVPPVPGGTENLGSNQDLIFAGTRYQKN
ncbi:hypothetical protein BHM03_00047583, partial [Ensete ventricosum]